MKRFSRVVLISLILLSIFSFWADAEDIYEEQFNASGFNEVLETLPDDAREYFSSFSSDLSDYNWPQSVNTQSIFERIFYFLKGGIKGPLSAVASCAAVMLLSAAVKSLSGGDDSDKTVGIVCIFGICSVLVLPICTLITSLTSTLKGCSTFMLSFVPMYTGILAVSGRGASAVSGGLLLTTAEAVSVFVSFVVAPMCSATLALGISSSVSMLSMGNDAAASLKKIAVWCLGTVATVFTGVLSMQSLVGAAADNMKLRTAKMFTSSVIPFVGSALSESLSTVVSCFSVLRSTAGIFGILALFIIMLPILIEIALWRVGVMALGLLASFLGLSDEARIVGAIDSALSLMAASSLIISLIFIISLTVMVMSGGTV